MAITGLLLPIPRLGNSPAAAAKLFLYQPGTTTKITTYSDSALTSANANPVVADSAGLFGAIYIDPAIGVKAVLYASTETNDPPLGTPIWSQDNAYLVSSSYTFAPVCNGRLTLTSATPITTADVSAATTLYCTPYLGNRLALYNSTKTAWELLTFSEISISLAGLTASTPYDVFVYNNAGTAALELTAWTNTTTRATALALQDGVYVKSGTTTRRYLGTVYINSSGGQTDDTAAKRYLWNYYHRDQRTLQRHPTGTWTYTTTTLRQANGSTANQVEVVVGVAEVTLDLSLSMYAGHSAGGVAVVATIGEDSTTAGATGVNGAGYLNMATTAVYNLGPVRLVKKPVVGYHKYTHLEYSGAGGTTTWYSDDPQSVSAGKGGLTGSIVG